jgi:2-polyprenyl-3-methyl-5-hydroxy-6-metoxy-1,4-benzoquinol methylase
MEGQMPQPSNPWNEIFKQKGAFFTEPHEDMPNIAELLSMKGAENVLDFGCGSGRHVFFLARKGFSVFGFDDSPEGIEITRNTLAKEGLSADLKLQGMAEELPYDDDFFDAVIAVQVIHHADIATIESIVHEITRVLKKDGLVFITVPKLQNQAETFKEIEPHTFVPLDGPEKGLPHHYFTPEELRKIFNDYNIIDIHLDSMEHYCLSAFKR